jgi:hypothetical protein
VKPWHRHMPVVSAGLARAEDSPMSARQLGPAPASPTAKRAHQRSAKRSKRWHVLTFVAVACAAMIYWGASWQFGSTQSQRIGDRAAPAHESDESRTGKIVLQTNSGRCAEMEFDNTSGRFVDGLKPCDDQIKFDEHGRPIPIGTIHRLDAISRSFFGR